MFRIQKHNDVFKVLVQCLIKIFGPKTLLLSFVTFLILLSFILLPSLINSISTVQPIDVTPKTNVLVCNTSFL